MMQISFLFLAGYLCLTLYYFIISSQPVDLCDNDMIIANLCAFPLFSSLKRKAGTDFEFLLEIYIENAVQDDIPTLSRTGGRPKTEWKLLSTCDPMKFTISVSKIFNKVKFGGKKTNCTLDFPEFSRIRVDKGHPVELGEIPTELKAMFVLKWLDDNSQIAEDADSIARTIVELTRIVEWRGGEDKVPHYKYHRQPIVLRLVADDQVYPIRNPMRGDGLRLHLMQNSKDGKVYHRPTFHVDDVALKHSSQIQLAPPEEQERNPRPPINVSIQLSIISPQRHVAHRQLLLGFEMAEKILRPNELDELRHMISDDYIYRFILTQIISFIHVYLDYAAFRDEIGFYAGRKSMGGVSFSTVLGRFICQLIIFLYLCDGGGTSWLVLGSIGSGVALEFWKCTKFLNPVRISSFPFVKFRGQPARTQLEQDTVNYDGIARTYLALLLYPIVLGSAIYTKKFYVYTCLWSWAISNLANAVYTFGFISLCPQLYINYRLKSVAHLPVKVFLYKIFNTFIDDIFAFMIESPLKVRV